MGFQREVPTPQAHPSLWNTRLAARRQERGHDPAAYQPRRPARRPRPAHGRNHRLAALAVARRQQPARGHPAARRPAAGRVSRSLQCELAPTPAVVRPWRLGADSPCLLPYVQRPASWRQRAATTTPGQRGGASGGGESAGLHGGRGGAASCARGGRCRHRQTHGGQRGAQGEAACVRGWFMHEGVAGERRAAASLKRGHRGQRSRRNAANSSHLLWCLGRRGVLVAALLGLPEPALAGLASVGLQVEDAMRLGVDLPTPEAAIVWSTLCDMVAWVQRPPTPTPARPLLSPRPHTR